mmetsp:Transcript_20907/g.41690  ORF Transcript_20907/g.41690 Transcript_20907/m.41690 type:complete len:253 (+) Transcript_20907:851-1609(+)
MVLRHLRRAPYNTDSHGYGQLAREPPCIVHPQRRLFPLSPFGYQLDAKALSLKDHIATLETAPFPQRAHSAFEVGETNHRQKGILARFRLQSVDFLFIQPFVSLLLCLVRLMRLHGLSLQRLVAIWNFARYRGLRARLLVFDHFLHCPHKLAAVSFVLALVLCLLKGVLQGKGGISDFTKSPPAAGTRLLLLLLRPGFDALVAEHVHGTTSDNPGVFRYLEADGTLKVLRFVSVRYLCNGQSRHGDKIKPVR